MIFSTAEDATLTINALANDEVIGVSVSEYFRILGIELPVTLNPTTGDPASGDPIITPFDPINIKSSNDNNFSFFDHVVDFFRNGGQCCKACRDRAVRGLFVRLSLIGDDTSENGGSVTQNPDGTFNYTLR